MTKRQLNRRNSIIKYCCVCKIELSLSNWSIGKQKNKTYICNTCQNIKSSHYIIPKEKSKLYREKNKVKIKDYHRQHWIKSIDEFGNHIMIRANKRLYPQNNVCEICNKIKTKLDYHHWDNEHPENGIWCCAGCHQGCNALERIPNLSNIYILTKQRVEAHEC